MGDELTCCTSHWSSAGASNATEPLNGGADCVGMLFADCFWRHFSIEGRYCVLAGYPLVGAYPLEDDDDAPLSGHIGIRAPRCMNCSGVLLWVSGLAWSAPVSACTGCGWVGL